MLYFPHNALPKRNGGASHSWENKKNKQTLDGGLWALGTTQKNINPTFCFKLKLAVTLESCSLTCTGARTVAFPVCFLFCTTVKYIDFLYTSCKSSILRQLALSKPRFQKSFLYCFSVWKVFLVSVLCCYCIYTNNLMSSLEKGLIIKNVVLIILHLFTGKK